MKHWAFNPSMTRYFHRMFPHNASWHRSCEERNSAKGCPPSTVLVRNAASRPAPLRRVSGPRRGRLLFVSPPELPQRVRKAPAMLVHRTLSIVTDRLVAFPDHLASIFRARGGLTTVCETVQKSDQAVGSDEQRAADDHHKCFADPPGQSWRKSINQVRSARPSNSRDGAGRDAAFRTNNRRRWATHLLIYAVNQSEKPARRNKNKSHPRLAQTFCLESKESNHYFPLTTNECHFPPKCPFTFRPKGGANHATFLEKIISPEIPELFQIQRLSSLSREPSNTLESPLAGAETRMLQRDDGGGELIRAQQLRTNVLRQIYPIKRFIHYRVYALA